MHRFSAKNVPVLRFSNELDRGNLFLPTDAYCIIKDKSVPLYFEHDKQKVIGEAKLKRVGNRIIAKMTMVSTMEPAIRALELMRSLTPSVEFQIMDVYDDVVLSIQILSVSLIAGENPDPDIKPLGSKVQSDDPKNDLH